MACSRCLARTTALVLGLTQALLAHGGQYRSPTPNTGVRDGVATSASWQAWWQVNQDQFLRERIEQPLAPSTGSDDFYLGQRRSLAVDMLATTDADRRDRIVPALVALLDAERSRDIQSACLVALGKVGLDAPGIVLEQVLAARIVRDDQEVRETAVLALGIGARVAAVPRLLALARDEAEGRKLVDSGSVGDRVRAFAVYGLALIARRNGDAALQGKVWELCRELRDDSKIESRDLRVAAVLGAGILRADVASSANKRLAWLAVEDLLAWYQQDRGPGEEFVQAHAPVSISRLLGRGDSELHRRCKAVFVATLEASSRRGNPILRSAAIALGAMALPEEVHADDGPASRALQNAYEAGREEHVRMFSVMALGRIGGSGNRSWLMSAYARGNKTMEKPWLALGLGLLAAQANARGAVDVGIARLLVDELSSASHEDMRTPLAIAVGLTGHEAAVPVVVRLLREHGEVERLAGYLCTALGLLGDREAVPVLTEMLVGARRRPFVLQQAAIALARLGDRDITPRLLVMMRESDSVAVLSSLAAAIARIGDRRAIDDLLPMLKDAELPNLGRAFAAAALGGVGDKDVMPWNLPLMTDANYASAVDTLSNGATGILDIL